MIKKLIPWFAAFLVIVWAGYLLAPPAQSQIEDVSNFTGIHIKSSQLGTATPQFMIWNQGAGNAIEVRSTAGTVVYSVDKSGNETGTGTVNGKVWRNGTANQIMFCAAASFTTTAAITVSTSGIATPIAANCTLGADLVGTQWCTYANSSGGVTFKVWDSVLSTPAAETTAVASSYCIYGN